MNAGLCVLAFRRSLAPAVLGSWAVLAFLLLQRDWAGENALIEAGAGGGDAGALARGMTREGVWTVLVLAIVPLLIARAARTVSTWRAGEAEWLGSRSAGRGTILVSTWLGTWSGATALLALSFLAIELRAGPVGAGGPSLRRAGEIAVPPATWIEANAPLAWTAPDPRERAPAGARVRIELGFGAGSGASTEIDFRARRERVNRGRDGANDETGERITRGRMASRGFVEVELPPGPGDLRLELSCERAGARAFVISDAGELWVPCASERAAGAGIFVRLLLALAAWIGLALGLGAWVSAPTAALALLAAWIPAWLGDRAPAWLPGADLWDALEVAGSGRVPAAFDLRSLALAAALAAFGLVLGAAGLRRWRTSP